MMKNMAEDILKRDRLVLVVSLVAVVALAWAYTIHLTRVMNHPVMDMEMVSPHAHAWTLTDFYLNFLMWTVMQIAMMTPTAAPMLLLFIKANRQKNLHKGPYFETGLFLLGYLIIWAGFSFLATVVQWGLQSMTLLSAETVSVTPTIGGILLIVTGFFQFSPLKNACLTHCRTPVEFIMTRWQDGKWGAIRMGILHGAYCVGCCWLLMALLFAVGVMNLLWMAILTIFVLVEKIAPGGDRISRGAGVIFILWGIWMLSGM